MELLPAYDLDITPEHAPKRDLAPRPTLEEAIDALYCPSGTHRTRRRILEDRSTAVYTYRTLFADPKALDSLAARAGVTPTELLDEAYYFAKVLSGEAPAPVPQPRVRTEAPKPVQKAVASTTARTTPQPFLRRKSIQLSVAFLAPALFLVSLSTTSERAVGLTVETTASVDDSESTDQVIALATNPAPPSPTQPASEPTIAAAVAATPIETEPSSQPAPSSTPAPAATSTAPAVANETVDDTPAPAGANTAEVLEADNEPESQVAAEPQAPQQEQQQEQQQEAVVVQVVDESEDRAPRRPTLTPDDVQDRPSSEPAPVAPTVQPAPSRTPIVAEPTTTNPSGLWCEVANDVIRWSDGGRTATFRVNGDWFNTPDPSEVSIRVPGATSSSNQYVLRAWEADDVSYEDVTCNRVTTTAHPDIPAPTVPTTTTTAPAQRVPFTCELRDPIGIPGGPVQFGFNVDQWAQDRVDYWNELESVPGSGRLIAHEFKSFFKPINTGLYQWHIDEGRDLLLTWNGTNASQILNGSNDEWIRQHARELSSLSDTIKLRFWHEPDVRYKVNWIEGDPQNFIDSWHYVRQIFAEENANNIEWVWCPTAWNWDEQGALFYPGDAHVDWICADGYSGFDLDRPLEPIADQFTAFQRWADQHPTKPIIIAEFGATARGPGERAEWVRGIDDWVNASPNIRAVVYFDFDNRAVQPWDWRIRTEPDAWQAVKDLLSSAPFGN